jgi:DNA-binding CsgD family transcriptional regulator
VLLDDARLRTLLPPPEPPPPAAPGTAPVDIAPDLIRGLALGDTLRQAAQRTGVAIHIAERRLNQLRASHDLPATSAPVVAWGAHAGLLDGLDLGPRRSVVLTPRQRDMLRLLPMGSSDRQVGERMWLSENTIRTHMRSALVAIGARTRAHAVALDWRFGYSRLPGGEQR